LPKFDVKFTDRISALWSKGPNSVTTTKEECETLDPCALKKGGALW